MMLNPTSWASRWATPSAMLTCSAVDSGKPLSVRIVGE
jgi:hypothetical protein